MEGNREASTTSGSTPEPELRVLGRLDRAPPWAADLLLALLAVLPYALALQTPFVFDDERDIVRSPLLHTLWPPGWLESGRPLSSLTLALSWKLGGGATWAFHLVNVALHSGTALALRAFLRRALALPRVPASWASQAPVLSWLTAALWAVHPLHTSAVTYVVHRYEVLASLFYLLALLAFLRAATAKSSTSGVPWASAGLLTLTTLLACWSKEIAVTLPVTLLLVDWTLLATEARELWRRRGALHALCGLSAVLGVLTVVQPRDVNSSQGFRFTELRPVDYARTQLGVLPHYLSKLAWPRELCVDYEDWPVARSLGDVAGGAALTALLLGSTAWLIARRRPLGLVGAWFFVLLAPTSTFLPLVKELVAERRLYLASASVALLVALGLVRLGQRLGSSGRAPSSVGALRAPLLLGGALMLALGLGTCRRNEVYASPRRLFEDNLRLRPGSVRVRYNLGNALKDEGDLEGALRTYRECMRLDPGHLESTGNALAAAARLELRNPWEGQERLNPALEAEDQARAKRLLREASTELESGHRDTALDRLRAAALAWPRSEEAHVGLAVLLALEPTPALRRGREALEAAAKAWALRGQELDPVLGEALGAAFAELGRFDDAIRITEQLRLALAVNERHDEARRQQALAEAYARHERWSLP